LVIMPNDDLLTNADAGTELKYVAPVRNPSSGKSATLKVNVTVVPDLVQEKGTGSVSGITLKPRFLTSFAIVYGERHGITSICTFHLKYSKKGCDVQFSTTSLIKL